jgi:hypothetical protein
VLGENSHLMCLDCIFVCCILLGCICIHGLQCSLTCLTFFCSWGSTRILPLVLLKASHLHILFLPFVTFSTICHIHASYFYPVFCHYRLVYTWWLRHHEVKIAMPALLTFAPYDYNGYVMAPGPSWMGFHKMYWMKH